MNSSRHGADPFAERMAAAARALEARLDLASTLRAAVDLAVSNVEACDAAGISFVRRGLLIDTPAATSDDVTAADLVEQEVGEGPCLTCTRDEPTVHVADLAHDARWPRWGSRVAETTGLRSVLCLRVFTTGAVMGALSLYSTRPSAFTVNDLDEGRVLAAHVAVAVAESRRSHGLREAMDSRALIGQAIGIARERYDLTPAQAWAFLTRISSTTETRLRDVAEELVRTRKLPPLSSAG